MRSLMIGLVIGASAVSAGTASAQVCAGSASFATGPARIGAGFSVTDGAKMYGVNGALGYQAGLFGTASLGRVSPDGGGDGATSLGVGAGYSMAITPDKKLQFCPVGGFTYLKLPDIGTESASSHSFAVGGMFGTVMPASPTLDFVPAAGLMYTNTSVKVAGISASDDHASLEVAAGFVLNKLWTIQPAASFPFSDGYNSVFTFGVGYSFGGAHAGPRR